MLGGTGIVYSAILTVFYLKRKLYRQHLLGIILILIGVLVVGLALYFNHRGSENHNGHEHTFADLVFGNVLLQLGILCGAVGYIIEEKFLSTHKRDLNPIKIVGCEGWAAVLMWTVGLTAFYYIPCSSPTFCP